MLWDCFCMHELEWKKREGSLSCPIKYRGLRGLLEEDIYFLAGVCLPFSLLMEGK
ncbi:hypothetical protein CE91St51_22130 [[Clostridium] innocuum]|nr:hypothetical protein CE91St51_22130 [[Clostridium] innocuum]